MPRDFREAGYCALITAAAVVAVWVFLFVPEEWLR